MNKHKTSITSLRYWQNIFANTLKIGINEEDNDEVRLHKLIMLITSVMISFAGIIWGVIYIAFKEPLAGLIPITYALITFLSLILLRIYDIYHIFNFSQILMILLLPFLLMISLGGFVNGSVVIVWGFFAPIVAMLSGNVKSSLYWFLSFVLVVMVSGFIQPYIETENNLPASVKVIFFVINIGAVSFVVFLVLKNFITKKDDIIDLMRQNRKLEKSYLQQEVALRESDKLATLGRLSAGMAHELNNPAAASLRGAKQLKESLQTIEKLLFQFGRMDLSDKQLEIITTFHDQVYKMSAQTFELDPLERSDRESELESWLEARDIKDAWNVASMLVSINFTKKDILILTDNFDSEQFASIVIALHCTYTAKNLLEEIGQGTGRISDIVKSLKSYSHMDQAPVQSVDVHDGLNDTLIMLGSRLKEGITVEKNFEKNLPHIQAHGSELNQVWTNIIDNAISAMQGKGILAIVTFIDEPWVVVQIKNNGPKIPAMVQRKIFDPFFTTKSPGEGTGLGLNISHNIIVQKHSGQISVFSEEDETCFQIKLPLETIEEETNI